MRKLPTLIWFFKFNDSQQRYFVVVQNSGHLCVDEKITNNINDNTREIFKLKNYTRPLFPSEPAKENVDVFSSRNPFKVELKSTDLHHGADATIYAIKDCIDVVNYDDLVVSNNLSDKLKPNSNEGEGRAGKLWYKIFDIAKSYPWKNDNGLPSTSSIKGAINDRFGKHWPFVKGTDVRNITFYWDVSVDKI